MTEIESKTVHVKIEPSQAIQSKRALLEMEISLLNMLRIFEEFRTVRKEETRQEEEARKCIKNFESEIEKLLGMLPQKEEKEKIEEEFEVEEKEKIEVEKKKKAKGISRKKRFELELKEIKQRLEALA